MTQDQKREAWVAETVRRLRDADSWCGRIHMHKHAFITKALGIVDPPFEFGLYHFGPYSRSLDGVVAEMEMLGLLQRDYPKPNYGPRYRVSPSGEAVADETLDDNERRAIKMVADALGNRTSAVLELIATCLWAEKREGIRDEEAILDRVAELKPRFNRDEIKRQLDEARSLEQSLTA